MTRPEWLDKVGGANALTWWSWVIVLPFALLISRFWDWQWLVAVLGTQVAIGGCMWIAHRTILRPHERRPRPITALTLFAALGVGRALTLNAASALLQVQSDVDPVTRIVSNGVIGVLSLSLIAIVVDDARTSSAVSQQLNAMRRTFESMAEQEQLTLQSLDDKAIAQIRMRLEEMLAAGRSHELRSFSEKVVRPLSHQLAQDDAVAAVDAPELARPPIRETARALAAAMRPAPPIAFTVITEGGSLLLWTSTQDVDGALLHFVIRGVALLAGAVAVSQVLRPRSSAAVSVALLVTMYAAVGAVMAFLVYPEELGLHDTTRQVISTLIFVPAVALGLSVASALNRVRGQHQQEIAVLIPILAVRADELREHVNARRLQLARFLHGALQSELVAASMSQASPDELWTRLQARFAELVEEQSERSAASRLDGVLDVWGAILEIRSNVAADCLPILERDSMLAEHVIDVLSEGLTNAVRHGTGKAVELDIRAAGSAVVVQLTSSGEASAILPGLGTSLIDRLSHHWELTSSHGLTKLTVALPTQPRQPAKDPGSFSDLGHRSVG